MPRDGETQTLDEWNLGPSNYDARAAWKFAALVAGLCLFIAVVVWVSR